MCDNHTWNLPTFIKQRGLSFQNFLKKVGSEFSIKKEGVSKVGSRGWGRGVVLKRERA